MRVPAVDTRANKCRLVGRKKIGEKARGHTGQVGGEERKKTRKGVGEEEEEEEEEEVEVEAEAGRDEGRIRRPRVRVRVRARARANQLLLVFAGETLSASASAVAAPFRLFSTPRPCPVPQSKQTATFFQLIYSRLVAARKLAAKSFRRHSAAPSPAAASVLHSFRLRERVRSHSASTRRSTFCAAVPLSPPPSLIRAARRSHELATVWPREPQHAIH